MASIRGSFDAAEVREQLASEADASWLRSAT